MFFFNVELIFQIHLLLFHIHFIDNATASANCRPAEYSTEEGCCPTCPPGKRQYPDKLAGSKISHLECCFVCIFVFPT